MKALASYIVLVGRLNAVIGRLFSWLSLATVIVCFVVVVQRYALSTTYLWMQDLYVWLAGAMFMAVGGFALLRDDHVRVDIFYRPANVRRKAWLDLIGVVVFLIPYCVVAWIYCWPYVQRSWRFLEPSANPGGMPGLFVLKTFILAFIVLVFLQGLAMLFRSILVLTDNESMLPESFRYPATAT
jgi:TRAP-type mannitol/chloroaromatic compound transport system permease small subunit